MLGHAEKAGQPHALQSETSSSTLTAAGNGEVPPERVKLKPLEPLLPGETRSEYLNRLEGAEHKPQQLVARIKRSSKYWGQTKPNEWFEVRVVSDTYYQLRGNNNNYRLGDVALGMRLDSGAIVDLVNGKVTRS
jgi:hypothetical protein